MNGELLYAHSRRHVRIAWTIFYVILAMIFIFGLYKIASRIRTHTLPIGQIELNVPYSKYLVGETVTFAIKNNFNSPIYVANECPAEPLNVYRQENGKWIRIHDKASLKDCTSEDRQIRIPAKGTTNGSFAPWHHLFGQPGKYRIVAFVEYYDALPYRQIEIVAAPPKKAAVPSTDSNNTSSTQPKPTNTESSDDNQATESENQ